MISLISLTPSASIIFASRFLLMDVPVSRHMAEIVASFMPVIELNSFCVIPRDFKTSFNFSLITELPPLTSIINSANRKRKH